MNYFEKSLQWFKAQKKPRQLSLVGSFLVLLILSIFLSIWVFSPHYAVLFSHLDSRDANQILAQLEQANIPYQVRNQGSDIFIDKNLIDKTRIKLMGSGMQLTSNVGFELFDKSDFGLTDFSQKINYQRALQGELERTIQSLEEVKQARVHLVIPENHLFQQEESQPRAAVTLHLRHALTAQQVHSIQQLITASVAHMPLSNVVVVDQNGNNLNADDEDPASNHFASKKKMENYLNEKVMQMLKPIFPDDEVLVKIDVTLNYDELQRERINPQSAGVVSHEKETQHAIATKIKKSPTKQNITREKSYQLGSEKEHFTHASGNIERLTVSVVVPQFTEQPVIQKIERLAKSIVGFDAKRGDSISVEALITKPYPFSLPAAPTLQQPTRSKEITLIGLGIVILLIATFLLRLRVRKKKRQLLLSELTQWLSDYE